MFGAVLWLLPIANCSLLHLRYNSFSLSTKKPLLLWMEMSHVLAWIIVNHWGYTVLNSPPSIYLQPQSAGRFLRGLFSCIDWHILKNSGTNFLNKATPYFIDWHLCLYSTNTTTTTTTKPYPTKWGQLHELNDTIVFYQKPCLSPTHYSLYSS